MSPPRFKTRLEEALSHAVLMVAVAVIVNNFSALPTRRYPAFKW